MILILAVISIIAGFAGLIWSADRFVLGASTTARNLGVSAMIIGMTIVAFGTSAPEIFTSAAASLRGAPELAIGNALGSNIANIGLVLGITAIVCPVIIPVSLIRQELPALLLVTGVCFFIFQDQLLNTLDGLLLLMILAFFFWRVAVNKSRPDHSALEEEKEVENYLAPISTPKALGLLLLGLTLMILSSNLLVYGAREITLALGVSDLVIGLTIVAIGTSLPELATTITSTLKGHHDLAIGNIVGSNIMNLLLVLPVPAFLAPVPLTRQLLIRDYGTMAILTLLFSAVVFVMIRCNLRFGRIPGTVLLGLYFAYTASLFMTQ